MNLDFAKSERSTVGIEWELALVNPATGELCQQGPELLAACQAHAGDDARNLHGEMLLNTIELVSQPRHTIHEAGSDLRKLLDIALNEADRLGVALMCAGTHPFADPATQPVTDKQRYATLVKKTRWWGRQMLIFGTHTHVGVDRRDKTLPILRGLLRYLPHLQALAASSPWWAGVDTGYASNRAMMFQQLPTAGLPYEFKTWPELEQYADGMLRTGIIDGFDELRWDIRPSPKFGTVEARMCDGSPTLREVLAVSALTQCLVEHLSTRLDAGKPITALPPWFHRENKWRAARYGLDATVITDAQGTELPLAADLATLLDTLAPTAKSLHCENELAGITDIRDKGASYQRQQCVAAKNGGDLHAVVKSLVRELHTDQL